MQTTTPQVKPKKVYGNELKFRQVQVIALLHPELIHMESWIKFQNGSKVLLNNPQAPACGSTGCLAGLRVALDQEGGYRKEDYSAIRGLEAEGRESFGITQPQARRLFYTDAWPVKFRKPIRELTEQRRDLEIGQFSFEYKTLWDDEKRAEHDAKLVEVQRQYAVVVAERVEHFLNTGR